MFLKYTIRCAEGLENNPEAAQIRRKVFIEEQGFENEFDDVDKNAVHAIIFDGEVPAATGRLYFENESFHIGRVAVLKEYRSKGAGTLVMNTLKNEAQRLGADEIRISAQVRAKNFYEKLGYKSCGEVYMDEFCPHIEMFLKL